MLAVPAVSPNEAVNVNEHYLNRVVELAETTEVEASEDILAGNGMKLLAKGARIDARVKERLPEYKLTKPLETMMRVVGGIDAGQVDMVSGALFDEHPLLLRMCGNFSARQLRGALRDLCPSAQLESLLSVYGNQAPHKLAHAVGVSLLGGAMVKSLPRAEGGAVAALMTSGWRWASCCAKCGGGWANSAAKSCCVPSASRMRRPTACAGTSTPAMPPLGRPRRHPWANLLPIEGARPDRRAANLQLRFDSLAAAAAVSRVGACPSHEASRMSTISAINVRNQFRGKVKEIIEGPVVSEVDVETAGGLVVTSVITTRSVRELRLAVGKEVIALVKSTEVSIATL